MTRSHPARWMLAAGAILAVALTAASLIAQPAASNPPGASPPPAVAATALALLHEAIQTLSTRALGRDRVDWNALEHELAATLQSADPPSAGHPAIAAAVARLSDPHARFIPASPAPAPQHPPPKSSPPETDKQTPKPDTPPVPAHPPIPTKPEGKMLDGPVAYLIIPGCSAPDADGLRRFALDTAAEIKRLSAESPRAWVIDLRFNGGGNLWPMVLGLRPLLGDGPLMTMVDGRRVESHFGVGPDGAWIDWGRGHEIQLNWVEGVSPPDIPRFEGRIAILLGSWTMSSGEALALCFAGREHTRTFGDKTAGLTTVTNFFPLSDGSVLNLPVSRMGDRAGRQINGPIEPAQAVDFGDWPRADDRAANAARAWALERP